MPDYLVFFNRKDPRSIAGYAQRLIGKTFQQVLDDDEAADQENFNNRGDLGQLIERHHFHYECNSDSDPDFKEAGVELKVTPYKVNQNGTLSAKERLVLTKINFFEVVNESFEESHLWKKSKLILLIYYLYQKEILKRFDYEIRYSILFQPPEEDKLIIKKDYDIIVDKIKQGRAHELSESDTIFLGACTKGAKGTDLTRQPYSRIQAKPRAFSFKQSYMTYVLNTYVVPGKETYEPIFTSEKLSELAGCSFEEALIRRLEKYVGMLEDKIAKDIDCNLNTDDKGYEATLVSNMLGVRSNRVEEFIKAGIIVKILRYRSVRNKNQQFRLDDVNFIDFNNEKFDDEIVDYETGEPCGWESSSLYDQLRNRKYLLAVFWEQPQGNVFKGCQLWGMPDSDIEKVKEVWSRSKRIVRDGIKLRIAHRGGTTIVVNNLPGISDNGIFHFRPHATKSFYIFADGSSYGSGTISDTDLLPDGRRMVRQAYWLNRKYIDNQIRNELRKEYN